VLAETATLDFHYTRAPEKRKEEAT